MLTLKIVSKHMHHFEDRGEYAIADAFEKLIIKSLSPNEKKVYTAIKNNPWISTPDLANSLGLPMSRAGALATKLYEYGVVGKQFKALGNLRFSNYYIWHVK